MTYDRRKNHDLTSLRADKEGKSTLEQTFQARMTSTFSAMRMDLESTARETNAYADEILGLMGQLDDAHLHKHAALQALKEYPNMNKHKFDALFSAYSFLLDELAPRRVQMIQAGEEATEVQTARLRKLRKDTMDATKRHLDEGREKQQFVTDASELIKHYKALVMAA